MKDKKLVIFGAGKIAEIIDISFSTDSNYEVVAFVVDDEFKSSDSYRNKPLIGLSELHSSFPPSEHEAFVGLGYQELNMARKRAMVKLEGMGYNLATYISSSTYLTPEIEVGSNVFIMNNVNLQPMTKIGSNTFVWSGALIGHHSTIGKNCWITSGANISGNVEVGDNTFIAVNATIANDIKVGDSCFVGANTLVIKDLVNEAVVITEGHKPSRLNSKQFLKISKFH